MYILIQGSRGSTHISETCEPPLEPDSHCEGPGHSVRKLTSRLQAIRVSSHADPVEQGNIHRDTSTTECGLFEA